jgi:hypothetical protein
MSSGERDSYAWHEPGSFVTNQNKRNIHILTHDVWISMYLVYVDEMIMMYTVVTHALSIYKCNRYIKAPVQF